MSRIVEIITTVSSEPEAAHLARLLVESRRAACVSLDPVRSFYRWKGAVCDETETRLVIKTTAERSGEVERWLREHHPYDTPAIVRTSAAGANDDYEAWVEASVRDSGSP